MNKHLAEHFTSLGLTVSNNSAYGVIRGYETNIFSGLGTETYPVVLHVSFYATDVIKNKVKALIERALSADKKTYERIFVVQTTAYGLKVGMNDMTVKKIIEKMPKTFDVIYGTLEENQCPTGDTCPFCGNKLEESATRDCNIDGFTVKMHEECISQINTIIEESDKEFAAAPNNILKGTLGALVGGIAGAAITFILYLIGYVSAISAVVAVILGAFLYQKFGGKPNVIMIVIVSAVSLVFMLGTVFGIYVAVAQLIASESGLSIGAFEAFGKCMESAEFSSEFTTNMLMTLLFSAIGIGLEIFALSKKIKRTQKIK
ncbi:MAG: hypothetical protein NC350_01255 [Corallococcus sp.]|nr:hypothetical protein [Corallococcus sp.]